MSQAPSVPDNRVVIGATVAAVIVIHRHRDNLARILAGTERRVGQRLS